MSFAAPAWGHVWTRFGSGWELVDDEPEATDSGWDSLRLEYVAYRPGQPLSAIALEWPVGLQIEGLNFWVQRAKVREIGGGHVAADLHCLGLLQPKGEKVRWSTATQLQGGENIFANGATRSRVLSMESVPVAEVERLIIGGTPATNLVGTVHTPTPTPPVRASYWSGLTDPTYHWPNGWVLLDLTADQLRNVSNAWLERRVWQYVFAQSP